MKTTKMLCGSIIFFSTLLIFGLSIDKIWYREDDLGQIINGIIRSKEDVIRVFSADEREFIVPINFKRSKANVISGFLRPLKNIFFTAIYGLWGLNIKAYFWHHVTIHALNALLFFLLLALLVPLWLATLGGLLFAFVPDNSWLAWIAATHNSLSTLFLLLSLWFYYHFFFEKKGTIQQQLTLVIAGFMFFISLLARENGIFYPFWLGAGVWLYYRNKGSSSLQALMYTCKKTWIFGIGIIAYILMRLWAFGIGTLERTLYNMTLRFPCITSFIPQSWVSTASPMYAPTPASLTHFTPQASHISVATPQLSLFEKLGKKITLIGESFFSWSSIMFSLNNQSLSDRTIIVAWWILLITLCWYAYQNRLSLLLFFIIGFYCFSWQAFVAYPAARYINSVYPLIIAFIMIAIHYTRTHYSTMCSRITVSLVLMCCSYALITGIITNMNRIKSCAASMVPFEQRYADFFAQHTFPSGTRFLLLGSPFVSDIQNIFQYFLHDLSVELAHELFATVAETGYFGCRKDFRSVGVKSSITPIEGGYRFQSQDPHCAWWMHFSDHPVRWSPEDGAYRWSATAYQTDIWYPCSIGAFRILKSFDKQANLDMLFRIDKKWIDQKTVVVSWDTFKGKYITLDTSHLLKNS